MFGNPARHFVHITYPFYNSKTYLPRQLEPRGEPLFIKGLLPVAGLCGIVLKDKIDKIIKDGRIDANAFVSRVCKCNHYTVVQLYKIKK